MKASVFPCHAVMLAVATLLVGSAQPAAAVEMSVYVTDPYQVMTGSSVRAGHTVIASTAYNRLTAGGEFEVRCNHPTMSLSAPGRRTESGGSGLLGGVRLTVTIPYQQPAYVNMAGFHALPRGAIVECQYDWNAMAIEGHYTIGAGGTGMVIGQGEKRDGGYSAFRMQKPGTATGEDDACLP
jgi:hypothetical protein